MNPLMADWSDGAFAPAQTGDAFPVSQTAWEFLSGRPSDTGALFDAAQRTQLFAGTVSARAEAEDEVFGRIARRIKEETGVDLPNPRYQPLRQINGRLKGAVDFDDPRSFQDRRNDVIATFMQRARELRAANPDRLADLDLDTDPEEQAQAIARQAFGDQQREGARPGGSSLAGYAVQFAGAMYGSRRDPLMWLSLPFGGAGTGATASARIATAAAKNAGVNAGFAAAGQPLIQQWRAEAGLPSGFAEAAGDVLLAAGAGGVLGGGIQGLREAAPALKRLLGGQAAKADLEDLSARGLHVSEETGDALRGAARADQANAEMEIPPGVSRETIDRVLPETLAHLDDPAAPRPVLEPVDVNPEAAARLQRLVDDPQGEAGARGDIFEALRADPELARAAQAADDPELRMAGRLAVLPDDAMEAVRGGQVDPVHASAITGLTDDANEARMLMRLLVDEKPVTVAEARVMLSDALSAERARRAYMDKVGNPDAIAMTPGDYMRRIEQRARALAPDVFARADALDNDLASLRSQLRDLVDLRQQGPAPSGIGNNIASLQDQLNAFTGKRRSSPRAKALRDEIEQLKAAASSLEADAAMRLAERESFIRQQLAELDLRRREVGPDINRAMTSAQREATEIGVIPVDDAALPRQPVPTIRPASLEVRPGQPRRLPVVNQGDAPLVSRTSQDMPATGLTDAPSSERTSTAAAGGEVRSERANLQTTDLLDQVPIPRDDGTVEFLSRDALAQRVERESFFADVVKACKT